MLVSQAIQEADRLKPNAFPTDDKLRWLERLERRIRNEILAHYVSTAPEIETIGAGDLSRELSVPAPYDEMYVHWLCAQMDYFERELDSFNASNAMFEAVFRDYRNAYNRDHRALSAVKKYF